jgi:aspartyl-tRNA(Asn)/glutamyl-tRNA(Gln) amidotransferase subunit C
MAIISQEEVLKIAKISHITVHDDEVGQLTKELEAVLSYAARVQEIAAQIEEPLTKNINVFREDTVCPSDPETILQQAPQREENFFVVPAIIEK